MLAQWTGDHRPRLPHGRLPAWLALLVVGGLHAQSTEMLPTRGKRFWTGFMQNGFNAQSLTVHIMGSNATSGTVSIPGMGWSTPFTVAANGVTVVNVPAAAENTGSESAANLGVLVESQDSINVFIRSFQNYTQDMSQVLPEHALGNRYRLDAFHGIPNFGNLHRSQFIIIAAHDGTEVRITPTANTMGGHPAGVPFTVTLNAGQTYQVKAAQDLLDLTGTVVEATAASGPCRPFAVIAGSSCAMVPGGCYACDVVFEQAVPTNTWGTRYLSVPVHGLPFSTCRILADEDNTTVTVNGGTPITLNAGQTHTINANATPLCIEASKRVSVAQLLEGYDCAGNGDPSMVLLSPANRLSKTALFHAQGSGQVTQWSISLVVPVAAVGQLTLDGSVVNPALFQPYPACTDRRHAKLTVSAGAHRVQAAAGFQLYAFGLGYGESFATGAHDIRLPAMPQDSVICGGGPATLHAPVPLTSPQWTAASAPNTVIGTGNSITVNPTGTEHYTVSGLLPVSGCQQSFTFHVGQPLTIPTLLTADGQPTINVCQYEPVQLALVPPPDPAWFQVQWSPPLGLSDPNSPNPVASPAQSTWYTVNITNPSGCPGLTDSIHIGVSPGVILDLDVTASPAALCAGGTTQLTSRALRLLAEDRFNGPPGTMWTAIQGGAVSNACGSVEGTALYFNGNGQRYAQTVAYNTIGGGELRFHLKIGTGPSPCADASPGEDVVLEYSTNNGFSWTTITLFAESAHPVFTPVAVPLPPGAQGANVMFRLRQLANSGAGHDNWAVDDLQVARVDNTWLNYAWTPGTVAAPTAPNTTAQPTASGWYTLLGTDPIGGCTYSDSVFIQVEPAFSITASNDTVLCAATGLQLNAVPNYNTSITWSWTPNNGTLSSTTIANPYATPATTTTYTVTATTGIGCTASDQVSVTVGGALSLALQATPATVCQGQSVQLSAVGSGAPGLQYTWSGPGLSNASIPNPTALPVASATYTCTITDPASGCSLTQQVAVTVTTGYTANAGPDLTLCSALGHQLSVQHNVPNASYQWSPAANLNAANIQAPTILNDASATYTVVVTDANGCSVSDQVVITRAFEGLPTTLAAAACANAPPLITAPQPGVSYSWNTGANTPSITPTASGAYTVTITDANGCQGITTFNVTLHPLPVVDLGPDVSLCGAASHVLNAGNPGSTFAWNTGGTAQSITVTNSGTYSVVVTSPQGCSASDAVSVTFHPLPADMLQDITACSTGAPLLNAGNPGSTYLWSTGASTQTIVANASGTYAVTITTPQGCSATYDAQVTLVPAVSLWLGNDTSLCQGQTITLNAGNPGSTYLWSTGATTQQITVNTTGSYAVTVTNGPCTASDAVAVEVMPTPQDVLADATACTGQSVTLDAGNPGSSYLWSNGATTQSIATDVAGTYTVTVTNAAGCTAAFEANVQLVPPPVVDLGPDTALCQGQTLTLDAGNPGCTYLWSTGATTPTITVGTGGRYRVTVDNGHCQGSDQISITFKPSPVRMAVQQFYTCLDEAPHFVVIDAGNPGSRYEWSTGATTQVILAGAYGWYFVEIVNAYDCAMRDSAEVREYCPSSIYLPNTFTPNGDGLNDIFIPVGKNIATMELLVFDRWGGVIFESGDPNTGWDGTHQGEPVKNDVYVWRLRYRFYDDKDGKLGFEQERMGHVQVLR